MIKYFPIEIYCEVCVGSPLLVRDKTESLLIIGTVVIIMVGIFNFDDTDCFDIGVINIDDCVVHGYTSSEKTCRNDFTFDVCVSVHTLLIPETQLPATMFSFEISFVR